MTFTFSWLCELLEDLEQARFQQRATYSKADNPDYHIVRAWYNKHSDSISRTGPSAVAFVSALLPERRPDRTYDLQDKRLCSIFGRVLSVGASRVQQLQAWQKQGGPEFALCVKKVMAESEFSVPAAGHQVTLEEIDEVLTLIAANALSSSPAIKARANDKNAYDHLAPIIRRLQGDEAKWLIRMIRKSYSPIEIPEFAALHAFHFLLPRLLGIQNSVEAAISTLSSPDIAGLPPRPSREYETALLPIMSKSIHPLLGVMIKRQALHKARSIKHCANLAGSRVISVEHKYDGEYCQIHIDRSKGPGLKSIQIFSKSGKDSTYDRLALHDALRTGLSLDRPDCKIKERAILEGELLAYSRSQRAILPFYHVRKHVRHGGRRIGTENDSPKKRDEHLMIMFFDVLMHDDYILVNEPHSRRRAHLKGLVTKVEGTSEIVERALIDFKHGQAPQILRNTFGGAIRKRWEGLVLKGLEDRYFSWKENMTGIKLKKDYIAGMGDTADLCIIGGRRDAEDEFAIGAEELSWTRFYVACLINKDDVVRYESTPAFRIVDQLGAGGLSKDDIHALNAEGKLLEDKFQYQSDHMIVEHPRKDIGDPTEMFVRPMVVEVMGASFERPQTVDFFTLRFPRRLGAKIKIHRDRSITDTTSFVELQEMAEKSMNEDPDAASQEDAVWIRKLEAADPRSKYRDDCQSEPWHGTEASTQTTPLLVRIDTDEMTSDEFRHRYPDSAPPQTPDRRTQSTVPPTSATPARAAKRPFENSPLHGGPQTTKRVRFGNHNESVESTASKALADITTLPLSNRNSLSSGPLSGQSQAPSKQQLNHVQQHDFALSRPAIVPSWAPTSARATIGLGMLPTPPSTAEGTKEAAPAVAPPTAPQVSRPVEPSSSEPPSSPSPGTVPSAVQQRDGSTPAAQSYLRSDTSNPVASAATTTTQPEPDPAPPNFTITSPIFTPPASPPTTYSKHTFPIF